MDLSENEFYGESEAESEYSDDSQEDSSYVLAETQLSLSNLSLKKKTKTLIIKGKNDEEDECLEAIETVTPEHNEDRKSYETIQKIIAGGGVERLKVEQCKIYLRKHGLRLTGNKEQLIQRIKEHIEIVNGGGEKKYVASSFVLNCKGDACTGDVVMFEQNVYETFNIASRSANGPPCGTRVVAGRIVKESYGAAKQQHTFTIEVLWSKGEKPLVPLHPLLIKGRNLYRLKTMRQKWEDEGERQKMLSEKHARGDVARSKRETCIQKKEMRKGHKPTRSTRDEHPKSKQETAKIGPLLHSLPMKPEKNIQPHYTNARPKFISTANILPVFVPQRQPLNGITKRSFVQGQGTSLLPVVDFGFSNLSNFHGQQSCTGPVGGKHQNHFSDLNQSSRQMLRYKENKGCGPMRGSLHGLCDEQKQACRYYAQGRCHFGDRCRNLHGSASNRSSEGL